MVYNELLKFKFLDQEANLLFSIAHMKITCPYRQVSRRRWVLCRTATSDGKAPQGHPAGNADYAGRICGHSESRREVSLFNGMGYLYK